MPAATRLRLLRRLLCPTVSSALFALVAAVSGCGSSCPSGAAGADVAIDYFQGSDVGGAGSTSEVIILRSGDVRRKSCTGASCTNCCAGASSATRSAATTAAAVGGLSPAGSANCVGGVNQVLTITPTTGAQSIVLQCEQISQAMSDATYGAQVNSILQSLTAVQANGCP